MNAQRRPPRRRWKLRWFLTAAALAAALVIGIALGEALHDNPKGGMQTIVRTLRPLPLVPIARETVTVTTTQP